MEDIRFYNYEFELLDIEADFISSNWQVKFNAIGQFEAHFPLDSDIVKIAMEHPFLVALQGKNAAIVTGKRAAEDFTVFGRTCNWLLMQRVVPAFEAKTGTAGAIACELVSKAFEDVENFACEIDGNFSDTVSMEKEDYLSLFDVVQEWLELGKAGHEVVFDVKQKKWIFRVLCGSERDLMISEDNRNALNSEFCEDILEEKNAGWYQQEQEQENEKVLVWTFLNDTGAEGLYRRECVLSAKTQEAAAQELGRKKKISSLTAESCGPVWRKDYELGDVIRVQIKKGNCAQTVKQKITGVHLWYETGERGEQPIMEELDV